MNNLRYDIIGIILLIVGTGASIALAPDMWYMYGILLLIALTLWIKSITDTTLLLPFFFSGILLSFAAWFASPWLSIILLSLCSGIYLYDKKMLQTSREILLFLFLTGSMIITGIIAMNINKTIPAFFMICAFILLIIILTIIGEFRLQKMYTGEKE